jgi:hypothetical protein
LWTKVVGYLRREIKAIVRVSVSCICKHTVRAVRIIRLTSWLKLKGLVSVSMGERSYWDAYRAAASLPLVIGPPSPASGSTAGCVIRPTGIASPPVAGILACLGIWLEDRV